MAGSRTKLRQLFVVTLFVALATSTGFAAGGMFPKMPAALEVVVVDCRNDSDDAKFTARALQGLLNQSSAEIYTLTRYHDEEHLTFSKTPNKPLPLLSGPDAGLRTLFQKYAGRVKKLFVYDPKKDWTWAAAVMAGAQQDGIPVTHAMRDQLALEFGWKGEVEDFRSRWSNRIEACDWALTNLMPGCSRKVVFAIRRDKPVVDYAVASKGFVFWLSFRDELEKVEAEKIFQTRGYGVGTSLMGYAEAGDSANAVANKFGIGYVVSDNYANGSFWSSFPNTTHKSAPGKAVPAQPGKIYASIYWSDGDNISFDQNLTYDLWQDAARSTVPVATSLSPALQELNAPLLNWYYAHVSTNDELIAGPCGVQFIFGRDFNANLFPAWCALNRTWMADAGFRASSLWIMPFPGQKYDTYIKTCGLDGLFTDVNQTGLRVAGGVPVVFSRFSKDEEDLFSQFSKWTPNEKTPEFVAFVCTVPGFVKTPGGYTRIQRQIKRIEGEHPGRYVFLLPKDLFATARSYYHLQQNP